MIQSMTAFARAQQQHGNATLCWEIKSVNHRYREILFRMPESLRSLEMPLRQQLGQKCSRGKFECQLKLIGYDSDHAEININQALVSSLRDASLQLAQTYDLQNDISVSTLLGWPGVIDKSEVEMEDFTQPVTELFSQAVNMLIKMRRQEGASLHDFMHERLHAMDTQLDKAHTYALKMTENAKRTFKERIDALKLSVDPARVEQETAILITRLDVSEELARIKAHLLEVRRVTGNNESVGRRLDFLMQELNREVNTISSKSEAIALTQCAVEMKVLIEQMREQVQNIE